MNMSQIWHDLISELESTVAPVKHLFDEHQLAFDEAVRKLREQADAEAGHLIGDAEAAGKTALGQIEADAAPVIAEAKQDAADLAHTAEADLHDVVESNGAPAPAPAEGSAGSGVKQGSAAQDGQGAESASQPAEQSAPETAA